MKFMREEKQAFLLKNNSKILVVIVKEKKHGSGYFFRYEVYLRDAESCYTQFALHKVDWTFAYTFNDAYHILNNRWNRLIYNY